jgi:DNA replication protein DnaC
MTDHEAQTISSTCTTCGAEFQETVYCWNVGLRPPDRHLCGDCCEKQCLQEEFERNRQIQDEVLEKNIPPLYLGTNRSRMDPKLIKVVDGFVLNSGQGLFLSGDFGKQKTRACALLLERYCRAGYSIRMIQSTVLAKHVVEQFSDDEQMQEKARKTLRSCHHVNALFIDDLGKERATERFETELFSIIECRTSTLLPTLYTSNLKLADLLQKFSPDNGGGIVRRITEFSQRINV